MKNKNLFLLGLIYFITMVLFVGLRILSSAGIFSGMDSSLASNIFTIIIQVGIMFLLPVTLLLLFFKKGVKNTFKDLGFKKISKQSILIALGIGLLAFLLNLIVSTVFNGIIGFFGYNPSSGGEGVLYDTFFKFLKALFFVAVLPGIFEEVMHRGVLLRGYSKEIGIRRALIISSILFGLMHLNVGQVFYASVMGFLMGVVAIASGSIVPAMLVHFVNNGINVYLVYAAQNELLGANFYDNINSFLQSSNPAFTFLSSFLFLGLLTVGILVLLLKLFRENKVNELIEIKEKVEKGLDSEIFSTQPNLEASEIAAVNSVLVDKLKPLLPDFANINSPIEVFVPKTKEDDYKPTIKENLFLYASLFLGIIITIFTFIWGVV